MNRVSKVKKQQFWPIITSPNVNVRDSSEAFKG